MMLKSLPGASAGVQLIKPTPAVQVKPTDGVRGGGKWNEQWNNGKRPAKLEPSSKEPSSKMKKPTKGLPGSVTLKPCRGKKCKPKPQTTSPPTKGPGGQMPQGKPPITLGSLGEYDCVEGKYCEHQLPKVSDAIFKFANKTRHYGLKRGDLETEFHY
jgi:hypothetical protein